MIKNPSVIMNTPFELDFNTNYSYEVTRMGSLFLQLRILSLDYFLLF